MKKVMKITILLGFMIVMLLFAMDCFALSIKEQWSKQFPNMISSRISADGDLIGLLSKKEYMILNQKGEVIKRGKNQNYIDIAVSKDLFVLSGAKTQVYDYSGKLIWEVPYHSFPYFSPLGSYLMLWVEDERISMYTKTGKKIIDFPISEADCKFSLDEKYVFVPRSGLYKISNGSFSRIITAHQRSDFYEVEYLGNSKNIVIACNDENRNISLTMYDSLGKILWKKNLKNYNIMRNFGANILLMEDYSLKYIDYSGKIKYNIKFEKQMFSGYESKELLGQNLFVLNGYDENNSYLYFINNQGQVVYRYLLPPFIRVHIHEKANLIYTMSSLNNEGAVLTLKCYRIIY